METWTNSWKSLDQIYIYIYINIHVHIWPFVTMMRWKFSRASGPRVCAIKRLRKYSLYSWNPDRPTNANSVRLRSVVTMRKESTRRGSRKIIYRIILLARYIISNLSRLFWSCVIRHDRTYLEGGLKKSLTMKKNHLTLCFNDYISSLLQFS